jgi:hypothetical protein
LIARLGEGDCFGAPFLILKAAMKALAAADADADCLPCRLSKAVVIELGAASQGVRKVGTRAGANVRGLLAWICPTAALVAARIGVPQWGGRALELGDVFGLFDKALTRLCPGGVPGRGGFLWVFDQMKRKSEAVMSVSLVMPVSLKAKSALPLPSTSICTLSPEKRASVLPVPVKESAPR